MPNDTSAYELAFLAAGLDSVVPQVRRIVVDEGLSRPYAIEVDVEIPHGAVEARAWLLTPAQVVAFSIRDGTVERRYTGLVTRVRERATRLSDRQHITVTVESPIAKLRLLRDHRIFQDKTTPEIVATLLQEAAIDAAKTAFRLSGSYAKREVCTQYGETTLAFVSRLLEEDGIFYFFEHGEDGPTLVFGDAGASYAAMSPAEVSYVPESGLTSGAALSALIEWERLRPGKVTLRDHDFKRPALDLEAKAQDGAPLGREHYAWPGRYVDPAEGKRRAQAQLDALAAANGGLSGTGTAFSFTPGHTFTLSGAPDSALDGEYVVRDVTLAWDGITGESKPLRTRFTLLPTSAPFRPPAVTPRAVVPGPQVAKIAGPKGEEIYCDEFGRVKVLFPWDRRAVGDDKSSAWVRVAQLHTSGSVAIPRVGWEVLVDFEDGDPDRPIVLGRVYNAKYGPPYPLPANKTRSSLQSNTTPGGGGSNEIRMEDSGGKEHVHSYAQKDANLVTANNKTEKVATNATDVVGTNHNMSIGASEKVSVGANAALTVGAAQNWSVGGSRTKTISGAEKVGITAARSLSIGGSHITMTPMTATVGTAGSLSETVGGSCIEAAALGVAMAVAGSASITVGAAKIEAVATGKSDVTLGARASTVGGAFISASGKDVGISVGGAKATTVGGAWAAAAGGDVEFSSGASLKITVGGIVSMNGAKIVLKVGGSKLSVGSGGVVIKSSEIKLTATGPQPELAPMVGEK